MKMLIVCDITFLAMLTLDGIDNLPGIARLSGVYVPFPYIAEIVCALLCGKEKNG